MPTTKKAPSASSNATEFAQQAQDQTLSAIRQTQHAVVEAVRAWAQAVESSVPETPSLPFAGELPSPQQILHTSFDFAEQLLKAQREFTDNVLAAAAPVLEKSQSPDA
jgi:hypothetical protein